jgi:hypothetical protein
MKNTILKTFTMFGLIAVISLTTVLAQAPVHLKADIPFDFVAGEKTLPAGRYIVRSASRHLQDALLIQSADGKKSALVVTNSMTGAPAQNRARLIFHQYGDKYFLVQVWSSGPVAGRALPESGGQRELDREMVKAVRMIETARNN